jgi:hypothetical protein
MMEHIAQLLERLAAELGTSAEYLWPLLVKQTVFIWWSYAATAVLLGLVAVGLTKLLVYMIRTLDACDDDALIGLMVVIAFALLGDVIGFFTVAIKCTTSLDWLFVPEAATIQRLLEMIP